MATDIRNLSPEGLEALAGRIFWDANLIKSSNFEDSLVVNTSMWNYNFQELSNIVALYIGGLKKVFLSGGSNQAILQMLLTSIKATALVGRKKSASQRFFGTIAAQLHDIVKEFLFETQVTGLEIEHYDQVNALVTMVLGAAFSEKLAKEYVGKYLESIQS